MMPGREFTSVIAGSITPTGAASDTLDAALDGVAQTLRDTLTSSGGPGQGNVVLDVIAQAFGLIACPKDAPDDKVPTCVK